MGGWGVRRSYLVGEFSAGQQEQGSETHDGPAGQRVQDRQRVRDGFPAGRDKVRECVNEAGVRKTRKGGLAHRIAAHLPVGADTHMSRGNKQGRAVLRSSWGITARCTGKNSSMPSSRRFLTRQNHEVSERAWQLHHGGR